MDFAGSPEGEGQWHKVHYVHVLQVCIIIAVEVPVPAMQGRNPMLNTIA